MNKFLGWMAGAAFAFAGTLGNAATIDVSAFDTSVTLFDEAVDINFIGPIDFLVAVGVSEDIRVESFLLPDPEDAVLELYKDLASTFSPASEVSIMTSMIELLFLDGAIGYLVTLDASGTDLTDIDEFEDSTAGLGDFGLDFTSADAEFSALGTIKLEQLSISAIPLPATFPLVLAGLGGLALVGRRRKTAA